MKLQRPIVLAVVLLVLGLARGAAAFPGDPAAGPSCPALAPAAGLGAALAMDDLGLTAGVDQQAAGRVCGWSCQYNPNFGTWKYWFAPNLSSCPVTQCQPRSGSSPSGTPCNQGDPDIPGDCVP